MAVIGGLSTFGSVIALPLGGGPNCNILTGGVITNGYNYSDDESCDLTGIGDVQGGAPPVLSPLGPNGGPTSTRCPAVPGPLVDQIPPALCAGGMAIEIDQRGLPRPEPGGSLCDIGAVEVQGIEPTPVPNPPSGDVVASSPASPADDAARTAPAPTSSTLTRWGNRSRSATPRAESSPTPGVPADLPGRSSGGRSAGTAARATDKGNRATCVCVERAWRGCYWNSTSVR